MATETRAITNSHNQLEIWELIILSSFYNKVDLTKKISKNSLGDTLTLYLNTSLTVGENTELDDIIIASLDVISIDNIDENTMKSRAFSIGTTHINASLTDKKYAVIGFKKNISSLILLKSIELYAKTNDAFVVEVWENPTISGTFTYGNIANTGADGVIANVDGSDEVTGGVLLYSGLSHYRVNKVIEINELLTDSREIVISVTGLTSGLDILSSINFKDK